MLPDVADLLEQARCTLARTVNGIITAADWKIGRRIVEYAQAGTVRAEYGSALLKCLSGDLNPKVWPGIFR